MTLPLSSSASPDPSSGEALARTNLFDLNEQAMGDWLESLGEPRYRSRQIIQWIHQRRMTDIDQMTDLSKRLRERMVQEVCFDLPRFTEEYPSRDGTIKWLCQLVGGPVVETVYIPEGNRGTLCISSQVGCALNCSFCSTARQGFDRNLSQAEIIGQVWLAQTRLAELGDGKVTNVVFMGMGEPLLNYEPVVGTMQLLLSDLAYGLSKYRVTLSTSGLVPQINRLKDDTPAALAISLHAPTDELRTQLVPINKKYPLAMLMDACRHYFPKGSSRHVTFEYVMLADVNDSVAQAKTLARLLEGVPAKINLIPFNSHPGAQYTCSSKEQIGRFRDVLQKAGYVVTVRKTRGDDVDGACGQLAGDFKDRTGRKVRWIKRGK